MQTIEITPDEPRIQHAYDLEKGCMVDAKVKKYIVRVVTSRPEHWPPHVGVELMEGLWAAAGAELE